MLDLATRLDRGPSWLRRFAYRVSAGRGLVGKLSDAIRFRFVEDEIPRAPRVTKARTRVLIGPANSAGQGYQWARALEARYEGIAATSMSGIANSTFRPEVDLVVPVAVYQRSEAWHRDFEHYLSEQSHVIWESGLPLLGRAYSSEVSEEITLLRSRGVTAGLIFHGSDIRPPSRHAAIETWSPFRSHAGPVNALEETVARNLALVQATQAPTFVSTPDLLRWVPDAIWCPVSIDVDYWRVEDGDRERGKRPIVAYAPTHDWLKGADRVESTLHRLADEGVIEYRRIRGIPHAEMPRIYAEADIVLDQFALGSYGVAACEAMASGKPVLGHVDDFTRTQVRELTGRELPVHETTVESLEGELRRAAAEPEILRRLCATGREFVEAVHDGRRSAEALAGFLRLSA